MLNGPSELGSLEPAKETPVHFGIGQKWKTPAQIIEQILAKHGKMVAKYPWLYICLCLLVTFASCFGLLAFRWENNIVRLWNPTDSETGQNFAWLWKNHPPDLRMHSIIFFVQDGDNILNKDNLLKIFDIRKELYEAVSDENVTWSQACLKVPLVPSQYQDFVQAEQDDDPFADFEQDDEFSDFDKEVDLSVEYYPEPYCSIFNSLDNVCFEDSLLEIFAQAGQIKREMIENLSQDQILETINTQKISGQFSVAKDFIGLLGGIETDSEGKIVKAQAVKYQLYGKMNVTAAHLESIAKNNILGDQLSIEQIDENTKSIEDKFISILLEQRRNSSQFMLDFIVAKSFPDAVNDRITGEIPKVLGSFALMFIYVTLVLGKLNCVDNKSLLSLTGLFSVIMALFTSYGICSLLGLFISPLHNFIPFLLLGLGVDDMFVIIQAFNQIQDEEDLSKKISKTLTNSGVAITVTSITDLLAFAVGGTTTVPALKSFCIYCGLGIFVVYIFQITWFTAWLVIDQRRVQARRNACFPCIKMKENDKSDPDQVSILNFMIYATKQMQGKSYLSTFAWYVIVKLFRVVVICPRSPGM